MPKTDGDITRQRILEVAEKLFSEKGYDASSMDAISKAAEINKATIYYHFKDKNDILLSLFRKIMLELEARLMLETKPSDTVSDKIRNEIEYLRSKRNILTIMIMEQLKEGDLTHSLFQVGKSVIDAELTDKTIMKHSINPKTLQKYYTHEFFTGFMPIIMYIVFEEKWSLFFGCNRDTLLIDFVEIFENTHLNTHIL